MKLRKKPQTCDPSKHPFSMWTKPDGRWRWFSLPHRCVSFTLNREDSQKEQWQWIKTRLRMKMSDKNAKLWRYPWGLISGWVGPSHSFSLNLLVISSEKMLRSHWTASAVQHHRQRQSKLPHSFTLFTCPLLQCNCRLVTFSRLCNENCIAPSSTVLK